MKDLNINIEKFVKKLQYLSNRNNGKINVSNNAAIGDFLAYLMDKNSWKDLKDSLSQKTNSWVLNPIKIEPSKNYEAPLSLYLDIHKEKNLLSHLYLHGFFMNFNKEINDTLFIKDFEFISIDNEISKLSKSLSFIKIKNNLYSASSSVKIGSYKNSLKSIETLFIPNANTLLISDKEEMHDKFTKIYEQIKNEKQYIIKLDHENTNNFKIDFIEELFELDAFNDFFACPESKHFLNFWLILIQQLREEYQVSFTPEFLEKSLNIDFLFTCLEKFSQEKPFLSSFFISYFKLIGIDIDKEELKTNKKYIKEIKINAQNILNHFKMTQELFFKIQSVQKMYSYGLFESHGKGISSELQNQYTIHLRSPEKSIEPFYHQYCQILINIINHHLSKFSKNDIYLFNHSSLHFKNTDKVIEYKLINSNDLEIVSDQYFNQIIFGPIKNALDFSDEFLKYFYLNTPKIENIFFNDQQFLKSLREDQIYLWKKQVFNEFTPQCTLEKFEIKNA